MLLTPSPDEQSLRPHRAAEHNIWCLTERQSCDLDCLLQGIFEPLTGFLDEDNYNAVVHNMRLSTGELWPIPITLDVSESFAHQISYGENILLTNRENTPLALLTVTSIWKPNKEQEAFSVFGTLDKKHPGVQYLFEEAGAYYVGGPLMALTPFQHPDFLAYRHTPAELKQFFQIYGWSKIIAFQTRNPIHKAHYELTLRAARRVDAHLLIHPVVGMTKPGDVPAITRVLCYEKILDKYPKQQAMLSVLPLAMRMAGPREAVWHAIIRKNYGVTHFIVGRDHAGPGQNSHGLPFYDPYAAQTILMKHSDDIGIEIVAFPAVVYVKERAQFLTQDEVGPQETIEDISGTELRRRLEHRLDIPDWFSFPDIIDILRRAYPPKQEQGYTILFTGLSGAGKSTLAKAVMAKLLEYQQKTVTLLDGDIIRKHLSSELGFSKKDRDTHLQRMGYVASEITKHKGVALCAAIAPYADTRQVIRHLVNQYGGFIEVYVSTPLTICKQRDIKGLYQKAEAGLISGFTGIDAPYQAPTAADVIIDTSICTVQDAVLMILSVIEKQGYAYQSKTITP